jgi:hypothetical protein
MYFNYTYSVFMVYFNVSTRYFNEVIVHLNVLEFIQCIFQYCNKHYNIFAMRICFSLSTMTFFSTCSTSFLLFPLIHSDYCIVHKSTTYQFLFFTSIYYPMFYIPLCHYTVVSISVDLWLMLKWTMANKTWNSNTVNPKFW